MGHPKFPRKQFETPKHPWKEERIKSERELMKKYGLKNHREIWKAKTHLGRYRGQARELLAKIGTKNPQITKESDQLLLSLTRMGILQTSANLDDVLALEIESVLSRRLQTLVYLKGLATTITHSRQLINHGHVAIDKQKVTIPGYIVRKDQEGNIQYIGRSPLNELSHPARPKSDTITTRTAPLIKEREETTAPSEQKTPIKTPEKEQTKPKEKDKPIKTGEKKTETESPTDQTQPIPAKPEEKKPPIEKQKEEQPEKPQEKPPTETKEEKTQEQKETKKPKEGEN